MNSPEKGELSDRQKIDRAACFEEVRFLKRQQWAVAAAGVVLLGALVATIRDVHMTALDKIFTLVLIAVGVGAGWFFLEDLQEGLARTRRVLDPTDWGAATRGREIMNVHKTILIVTALVVAWLIEPRIASTRIIAAPLPWLGTTVTSKSASRMSICSTSTSLDRIKRFGTTFSEFFYGMTRPHCGIGKWVKFN